MIKLREWVIEWGDEVLPVTATMVVDSLDKGIAAMHKEIDDNKKLRADKKGRAAWEKSLMILELVRNQFDYLAQENKEK